MLFSGLQLYVHGLESGHSSIGAWWPANVNIATSWTLSLFGGNMGVRIAHHTSMYLILVWVMCHIYYQVWRTIFWQERCEIAIVVVEVNSYKKKIKKTKLWLSLITFYKFNC